MKQITGSVLSGAVAIATLLGLAAATPSYAQTKPFKFSDVEYMPRDQREPAARAFLTQSVPPGTSLATAKMVLEQAGAYCPAITDATLRCTYSSMQRHPGEDEQDVTWKIEVPGDQAGRAQTASVMRTVRGN